jgi:hypothetical protein
MVLHFIDEKSIAQWAGKWSAGAVCHVIRVHGLDIFVKTVYKNITGGRKWLNWKGKEYI